MATAKVQLAGVVPLHLHLLKDVCVCWREIYVILIQLPYQVHIVIEEVRFKNEFFKKKLNYFY